MAPANKGALLNIHYYYYYYYYYYYSDHHHHHYAILYSIFRSLLPHNVIYYKMFSPLCGCQMKIIKINK